MGAGRRPDPRPRGARPARRAPPGSAHAALPRRAAGARGGPAPGPHPARHRGGGGGGPRRVPPDLRGRGGLAMTDPFEALREPVTPVDPDPEFAGRLRMRMTREVFAPQGGTTSQQTVATRVEREPAWPPTLTPYIVVSDARRAMDWARQNGVFPGIDFCLTGNLRSSDNTPHPRRRGGTLDPVTLDALTRPMGLMQSPRGVVVFDTKLRIVWANEAAGRPGDGLPTEAWPGRRLGEGLPRLDADVIEQSLRRVLATPQ